MVNIDKPNFFDLNKINIETAKFIFLQSEKKLQDLLGRSENITNRAMQLLIVIISIISAMCAYIFREQSLNNLPITYYLLIAITFIILFLIGGLLYLTIYPRKSHTMGTLPSQFLSEDGVKYIKSRVDEDQYIKFLSIEWNEYEKRIEEMDNSNNFRICLVKWALFLWLLIPTLWLAILLIGRFLI